MVLRTTLILNPQAGGGAMADAVRAAAHQAGLPVVETSGPDHVRVTARRLVEAGQELLLIGGGDGTMHEVVSVLAKLDDPPAIGVIPMGTANDFATGCRLPQSLNALLPLLDEPRWRAIDLIEVTRADGETVYLVNAATAGISSQIRELLDEDAKGWWGKFAYARAALEVMPTAQVYQLRLRVDDEPMEVEASALLVCNGPRAGGVELLPNADLGDGLMDVAVITTNDAVTRAALLARFVTAAHMDSPELVHHRCRRLRVESDPALHFVGDGEKVGSSPITFQTLPGKLRLLCGPP